MFMTKSEELVHYLTEEALHLAEKAIRENKVFHDDFDEWQGVTIPEALGGGEWDINISLNGMDKRFKKWILMEVSHCFVLM
jgi:hypothetical protein